VLQFELEPDDADRFKAIRDDHRKRPPREPHYVRKGREPTDAEGVIRRRICQCLAAEGPLSLTALRGLTNRHGGQRVHESLEGLIRDGLVTTIKGQRPRDPKHPLRGYREVTLYLLLEP
jgi:hypothetical protein